MNIIDIENSSYICNLKDPSVNCIVTCWLIVLHNDVHNDSLSFISRSIQDLYFVGICHRRKEIMTKG